jgi:hypothetical protein
MTQSLCRVLQPRQVRWSWLQVLLVSCTAPPQSLRRIWKITAPTNSQQSCQSGSNWSLSPFHHKVSGLLGTILGKQGMTSAQAVARSDPPPIDQSQGALERTLGLGQEKGQEKATPAQGPRTRPEGRGQGESVHSAPGCCLVLALREGGTSARVSEFKQKAVKKPSAQVARQALNRRHLTRAQGSRETSQEGRKKAEFSKR